MKGVCQTCGTIAPLEWFLADSQYRQCLALMATMPREVAEVSVRYMTLFRPASGRAMTPAKALRLLEELAALVKKGHVQVQGMPARPCPARIWADAMEQMRTNPKLRLPMKNHNYLREVAYDLADKADAQAERVRNELERSGGFVQQDEDAAPPKAAIIRRSVVDDDGERCSDETGRQGFANIKKILPGLRGHDADQC